MFHLILLSTLVGADPATVAAGTYRPLFPPTPSEKSIEVAAFQLDRRPVTNGEFLAFVSARPEWRRDRVAPIFAESSYLQHWAAADQLGPEIDPDQPVVSVSWFAARAYCASRGMRLPSEAEWELAAAASGDRAVIRDLQGLVWEWVLDFDAAVAAFSNGSDRLRFCGASASAAQDTTDFAAFERVAFRSSLRANYTTKHLGFRCAGDLK